METARPIRTSRQLWLVVGFGGVLALMAFLAVHTSIRINTLRQQRQTGRLAYEQRAATLNSLRSALFVSESRLRDYLLDREPGQAAAHREALRQARARIDSIVASQPPALLRDHGPWQRLAANITAFQALGAPVLFWSEDQRRVRGRTLLDQVVLPRFEQLSAVASEITEIEMAARKSSALANDREAAAILLEIQGTAAAVILLGLWFALFTIRQVMRLERESAERYGEVLHARGELQSLSARLVNAQEEERKRLARDLHDEVGQALSALTMDLAKLEAGLLKGQDLQSRLQQVQQQTKRCVGVVRNMALLLRPSMLDDLGLIPALRWQARETGRRTGIAVQIAAAELGAELTGEQSTCVYRVVQEALNNAAKHANPRQVRVTVRQEDGELRVSVQDDGRGFHPRQERGLGLVGIEERVRALGGIFRVDSAPGAGTVLSIALPILGQERIPK